MGLYKAINVRIMRKNVMHQPFTLEYHEIQLEILKCSMPHAMSEGTIDMKRSGIF